MHMIVILSLLFSVNYIVVDGLFGVAIFIYMYMYIHVHFSF